MYWVKKPPILLDIPSVKSCYSPKQLLLKDKIEPVYFAWSFRFWDSSSKLNNLGYLGEPIGVCLKILQNTVTFIVYLHLGCHELNAFFFFFDKIIIN